MLQFLLAAYYPFVGCVIALQIILIGVIGVVFRMLPCGVFLILIALGALISSLIHMLYACRVLFTPIKDVKDPLELKLPKKEHTIIYSWVNSIAKENDLIPPDEIRLGASAIAHVFESAKGKNVLVLGGMAVGTFTKTALSGIVAHELAHFTHGDTALSRGCAKRMMLMQALEHAFFASDIGMINPIAWLVILYHRLFMVQYCSLSQEQEYAADEWEVSHAGKEVAAATLIHLHVTQRMPWVRLTSVVDTAVATGQPVPKDVFAEQARRAKAAPRDEWERMMKKELAEPTKSTDSHPALKDRLAAIGVKPKRALEFALDPQGEPATNLFPAWESIQYDLSGRLTMVAFERRQSIADAGQILRAGM